ncbi:MAG: ERF family protein [Clostridiales bacterium]|nr:ERF family protein [Clostridiales bacterium]
MSVYKKLLEVQKELVVNKARETSRYKYRNAEDILEAVKPLLSKNQCCIVLNDDVEVKEGRFYVKATATFIDTETDEKVSVSSYAREDAESKLMQTAQLTGSSISYARKYALGGLLCIDDGNDADKQAEQAEKEEKKQALNLIHTELERTGVKEETIFITYKLNSLEDADNATLWSIYRRLQKTNPVGGEGC